MKVVLLVKRKKKMIKEKFFLYRRKRGFIGMGINEIQNFGRRYENVYVCLTKVICNTNWEYIHVFYLKKKKIFFGLS